MKKAAALIVTICMVFCAFSPVVVKAASSGFWYFSQADNNITELGSNYLSQYFPQLIHADDDVATVQQYFDEIRSQYPDLSYILTNSSNGLPNEEVITSGNRLSVMFFDLQDITIAYKGAYSTTDLMVDPHQQLSDATWSGLVNVISVTEEMPDSFHVFNLDTIDGVPQWVDYTDISYNAYWWRLSIGGSIISTDIESFYNGSQIGYYLQQLGDASKFYEAVQSCENVFDYMKVTDGSIVKDYEDYYGGSVTDFQKDTSLSLSSIDMVPLKDNYIGGMTAVKTKGAFNFNLFDTSFGGDRIKEAAAKASYGLQFDVTVNYNVDCSYDKAAFQALFGNSYSGSIHSTFYIDNITEAEAQKFDISVTLSDLLENADTIVTGDKQGLALLALINYAQEGERGSKTADFLGFGGLTLQEDAIVSEALSMVPLLGGPLDNFRDWISADYTYGLTELYYYADVTPYNSAVGIKGVMSDCECDLISGVHSGTAGGGYTTDPTTGEVIKVPDYKIGPDQNYLSPTILPGGSTGEIVVSGSPSNSSSNAQGGVANVNVQANPIINFENGIDTFMDVMNLSKNAETVQEGFWGFFGMFKDNPASELYRDYFGDIPEDFMKFLLACSGICFGLGVFRFVRGRYL